jgi:hypothetical protein
MDERMSDGRDPSLALRMTVLALRMTVLALRMTMLTLGMTRYDARWQSADDSKRMTSS